MSKPRIFVGCETTTKIFARCLSADVSIVETYAFEYPSVLELLNTLGSENASTNFWDDNIGEVLRRAGMVDIDDFMLISPRVLYLSTGIVPEKILLLFAGAERMIGYMHEDMQDDIEFIVAARKSYQLL